MPKPRVTPSQLAALAALVLVALTLGACQAVDSFFPPDAITSSGERTRELYDIVFYIAAAIFFLVEGLILYTVLRYRRKPTDTALPPQVHGNLKLEIVWTAIPTLIVAVLFVLSWQVLNVVEARSTEPEQANIRATAARYQWTFQYLDDAGNVLFEQIAPEMSVPVGIPVHLTLRSPDVIHSFYVPQFLFKRDVIPGRENWFDFTIDEQHAGQTFRGQCAHLCGEYHGSMLFAVKALPRAEYDAWVAAQIEKAQATPTPAPSEGAAAGPELAIVAEGILFTTTAVTAPADTPFSIRFENNDPATPHNVVIYDGADATAPILFDGEIFNGVESRVYQVPALPAGSYYFNCKVHPNMAGTLTVE